MIDKTLIYIRDQLNQHFKNSFAVSDDKVILTNLVESDGSSSIEIENKMVFFFLGLDEEASLKNTGASRGGMGNGHFAGKVPPLFLNLHIFFCANFKGNNYLEGLYYLSSLVQFFQQNKVMIPSASQEISKKTGRLSFELCKLSYDQMSHIWSSIGAKLLPSVLYRVGILVYDEAPIGKIIPGITSNG